MLFSQLCTFASVAILAAWLGGTFGDNLLVAHHGYAIDKIFSGEDEDLAVGNDGGALQPVFSDSDPNLPTIESFLLRTVPRVRRSWFDNRITARAPPAC